MKLVYLSVLRKWNTGSNSLSNYGTMRQKHSTKNTGFKQSISPERVLKWFIFVWLRSFKMDGSLQELRKIRWKRGPDGANDWWLISIDRLIFNQGCQPEKIYYFLNSDKFEDKKNIPAILQPLIRPILVVVAISCSLKSKRVSSWCNG